MIINMSGGGTGALLIRVVGGLTQPANPTYGTIWLQTDVPINGWEIFPPTPTWESVEGFVYIQNIPATSGEIPNFSATNASKKPYGAIWLQLAGAVQLINGEWVRLNGYMWRDGVWTQFSSKFSATIHVTYPAGSTCTATDGVTTLAAPDTSGAWACTVPNQGTWTVTATDGASASSEAVDITQDGQSKSVTIVYDLALFDNGIKGNYTTTAWAVTIASDCITISDYSNYGFVIWTDAVDLSKYNTIEFEYWQTKASNLGAAVGVSTSKTVSNVNDAEDKNFSAYVKYTTTTSGWTGGSVTLPTSGTYYPRIRGWNGTVKFRNIKLVKR